MTEPSTRPKFEEPKFEREKHIRFLLKHLDFLPHHYQPLDPNRLTLLYFILSGLDILGAIHKIDDKKANIINWIYSLQIVQDPVDPERYSGNCGFRPGPAFGNPYDPLCTPKQLYRFDQQNIAMTFSALNCLKILGDDFSKINKKAITNALKKLQKQDGSFMCAEGCESDMRFVYCVTSISTLLEDWSGIDIDRAVKYILSCQSYDFAFAQAPGQESHGGPTFCSVAALSLMGKLDMLNEKQKKELENWLINRQISGFNGRINKDPDACYSFWVGASLQILGKFNLLSWPLCKGFLFTCQYDYGGFGKVPNAPPDLLHTYLSYVTFAMMEEENLLPVDSELNLTRRCLQSVRRIKPENK